jgi:hypothetical protein
MDNIKLTEQEKTVIVEIAKRKGCDRDGDIISFFVKEDENLARVIKNDEISISILKT